MIRNQDRSGWFGASDTATIMGNWDTKTFARWWAVKLGVFQDHVATPYMEFGNLAEHSIIDAYDKAIHKGKTPIYLPRWRIRVNLDGWKHDYVVEVKTSKNQMKKLPKSYWQQTQVEMMAAKKKKALVIVYHTIPEEYSRPYYLDVDKKRLHTFWTQKDNSFLLEYLGRIRYLKDCLIRGTYP